MKNSGLKKSLSLFLSVIMIFTMLPIGIFALDQASYPTMMATNAASSNGYYRYYDKITSITFLDEIKIEGNPLEQWDMSAYGDGSVMGWMYLDEEATDAAGANRYEVYVAGDGGVAAHENSTHFFYVFKSLKEIRGMENFHTGNVKNFYFWFGNCNELETVDLSHLDTSSATSFELFFYGCFKLKEIDASTWNTSKVTTIKNMFQRCYALENANLSGWDTRNVTNMYGVFDMNPHAGNPVYSLKNVNLSGWDTSNVTTMENMFRNCENLKELDLSSFNTSKVTTMRFMFYYCKNLKYIYAGEGWTTAAIANINDGIFNCCYALVGQKDIQEENIKVYNEKHPSAYYPPGAEYAKFREDNGYLDNVSNKPVTPEYNVTYKFIGDIIPENVNVPETVAYKEGATVTVEENASAEHYIFSGWSTEDAEVENGEFVINNDVEFTGSWTKLYKVEYKYDEKYEVPADAPEIPDVELWYAPGEDVPVYGIPYVYEYVFVGWNTEDAEVVGDSFEMPENDVVLYGFYKRPVESVEIMDGEDITVDIDDKDAKINVYVKPEDATIKDIVYESSDEKVVTVDKYGNITPVGEGTATITVKSVDNPEKSDTITVTVKTPVTDIIVDKTEIELDEGETEKITVTVKPDNATDKEVTYESSDESIVKVDEKGNIKAVGEGTATITVTSKDNKNIKEEITVTVKVPVTELTVTEDFTLNIGDEKNVDAKVNEDATNKELIYESSDPGVVKVDSEGNVVAVGEGTATITVISKDNPSKKETITVTVKNPVKEIIVDKTEIELDEGETEKITVTVKPDNATDKEVTYESSDESVVKVDKDGNITAVGEGEAIIIITSKDDESIIEVVNVKVTVPVKEIIVDKTEIELDEGETEKITVTVKPDNATDKEVTYESSDESVVKVDKDGNITATGEGEAIIIITSKDDESIIEVVNVKVTVPVKDIIVDKTEIELDEGETEKITVTVKPDNATDKEVTYESSDESVVKVDKDGNITATGEGEAIIIITSKDDESIIEVVKVIVKAETTEPTTEEETTTEPTTEPTTEEETTTEPTTEPTTKPDYTVTLPDGLNLFKGESTKIKIEITPDNGKIEPIFKSGNESIVKVDFRGNVTAVGIGATTISVDLGNGDVRVIPVVVVAAPVKHQICFGKTDGIGWYEVSVNGGDTILQGPNSTLEVYEGSVVTIRIQDMWIDDDFDFYVNGKKVEDVANTIVVVVDGYMLIGGLSMDVEVPDAEESVGLFQKMLNAIKNFFAWIASWFK